jgi:hypothetical protein
MQFEGKRRDTSHRCHATQRVGHDTSLSEFSPHHLLQVMVATSPDHSSIPPSSAPFPTLNSTNGMSSPNRTRTPRRTIVDPLALDHEEAEKIQEDEQDRPRRLKARNLINNDVPQVRDSSGEAIVLLMEQFISERAFGFYFYS